MANPLPPRSAWKDRLHEIIFEADTRAGKRFDIVLLWVILASVAVVMLESVQLIADAYSTWLFVLEWTFTIFFTIEYILRLISVRKPWRYAISFFGIVDLLSILPSYLALFQLGQSSLRIIRIMRLLRVFRVLKLFGFVRQAKQLRFALRASSPKIAVFLLAVLVATVLMGTVMYIIEDPKDGFTSIPRSIYWAIVTLTTVGYGDIAPQTALGQALAGVIMIIGYAIIAVPTGIVSLEMSKADNSNTQSCPSCGKEGHDDDATYCKFCAEEL